MSFRCHAYVRSIGGSVFAMPRSLVALGSMIESLLCCQHEGWLAFPNLQSRLLDGPGK